MGLGKHYGLEESLDLLNGYDIEIDVPRELLASCWVLMPESDTYNKEILKFLNIGKDHPYYMYEYIKI